MPPQFKFQQLASSTPYLTALLNLTTVGVNTTITVSGTRLVNVDGNPASVKVWVGSVACQTLAVTPDSSVVEGYTLVASCFDLVAGTHKVCNSNNTNSNNNNNDETNTNDDDY